MWLGKRGEFLRKGNRAEGSLSKTAFFTLEYGFAFLVSCEMSFDWYGMLRILSRSLILYRTRSSSSVSLLGSRV